jgi:hypothetical protein
MDIFLLDEQVPIFYRDKFREYGFLLRFTSAIQLFAHCPWCAIALPESLSDLYYATLKQEYGIDDPFDVTIIPEEFKSDIWWRSRNIVKQYNVDQTTRKQSEFYCCNQMHDMLADSKVPLRYQPYDQAYFITGRFSICLLPIFYCPFCGEHISQVDIIKKMPFKKSDFTVFDQWDWNTQFCLPEEAVLQKQFYPPENISVFKRPKNCDLLHELYNEKITEKEVQELFNVYYKWAEDKNPPFKTKNGVPAFKRGNKWITPDKHGHKGGVWKFYFKDIREGTYNINLTKKIGK